MGSMKIDANGLNFIKAWEAPGGPELKPYRDSTGYSIGYGHFIQSGEAHLMNGITKSKADELFRADVAKAEAMVNSRVSRKLTQNQFNACVDLAYNYPNAFVGGTIEDKINAGVDRPTLEGTWLQYKYTKDKNGNTIESENLKLRRTAEVSLYYLPDSFSIVSKLIPAVAFIFLVFILYIII